jgi:superfamily I DNA/RNA helicase/ssDNA-binding Zn-finger/Zn-ribbon topoisomerase 1
MTFKKLVHHYFKLITATADDCPLCGGRLVLKDGRYGKFYGCENYGTTGCRGNKKVTQYNLEKSREIADAPTPQTQQPTITQQPQPLRNIENQPASAVKMYFLATSNADQQPYACIKADASGSSYEIIDRNGKKQIYNVDLMKRNFTSVKDDYGNHIKNSSIHELFKIYDNMQSKEEPTEQIIENAENPNTPKDEEKADTKIKGRIPAEKISPYQKEIETSFNDSKKNIMINALAGSGKTTVLKHIASFIKPNEKWLYLVFNKKNAVESKDKFPPNVEVMTSHSFLGRVLKENAESFRTLPNSFLKGSYQANRLPGDLKYHDKIDSIVSRMYDSERGEITEIPTHLHDNAYNTTVMLANLAKNYAISPLSDNVRDEISELIDKYAINTTLVEEEVGFFGGTNTTNLVDYKEQIITTVQKALEYSIPGRCNIAQLNSMRDHNDTLWFASINPNVQYPRYDVVLADEVQDFNACQAHMLRQLSDVGARIVAVGDPNQSIYRFRGSDSQSFNNVANAIEAMPNGGVVHELPKNYRSGRKIIQYVTEKTHVKNLQAGLDFDGEVTEGTKKEDAFAKIFNEFKENNKFDMPTACIARTNASLVESALGCLANDVEFMIIGVDLYKDIKNFIIENTQTAKTGRNKSLAYLQNIRINNLADIIDNSIQSFIRKYQRVQKYRVEIPEKLKMAEVITNVIANLESKNFFDRKINMQIVNAEDFLEYLKLKFASFDPEKQDIGESKSQDEYIAFTTAHRSKGLEFDRVFILDPDQFPSPFAKTPEELAQESNAYYVALTRAMKELHVLAPSENKDGNEERIMAKSKIEYGWYKKAQVLTPQQIDLYHNFQSPSAVKLIGSGMGASFSIPGLGAVIRGSELMNQVINKLRPVLTKNNVHTIDTNPVSRSDAIGLAVSSEPGTVHVDVAKIINQIKNQSLPSITQLDGTRMDADAKKSVIDRISGIILQQLGETAAHESKHNIDYFASFPKGKFESSESGAEGFGQQIAKQHFPMNFTANIK